MLDVFFEQAINIVKSENRIDFLLKELRDFLRVYITDSEFRISCVNAIITSIEESKSQIVAWNNPSLLTCPEHNISIRMIYWPGYFDVNPHKHKTWGVTGVFQNKVEVNIFDLTENPLRLKKNSTISAEINDVGYLLPGCVHNIRNISHKISSTFHIFNNLPGIENSEENAIWYPSPRKYNLSDGLTEISLFSCLDTLQSIHSDESETLIKKIFNLGSVSVKYQTIGILSRINKNLGLELFDKLLIC